MQNKYDVIVIGSGVGGLVCANYLAMAGKKVLVLEKNTFAGGYCSSFQKNGFFFNSCAHHLINDAGPGQVFAEILGGLNIYKKENFIKLDPLAVLYIGKDKYVLSSDPAKALRYLKSLFPRDDLEGFFSLMAKDVLYLVKKIGSLDFKAVADKYFRDYQLRGIFYALVFLLGEFPERVSGVYALKFIHLLFQSGAFYPKNGMQSIIDGLAENFIKNNGRLMLNNPVEVIIVKSNQACGVIDSEGRRLYSDAVVSNISPLATLKKTKPPLKPKGIFKKRIDDFDLAQSAFVIHLALKDKISELCEKSMYLIAAHYNKEDYSKQRKLYLSKSPYYRPVGFICVSDSAFRKKQDGKFSLSMKAGMYYKPKIFWDKYADSFADNMIGAIERFAPGLRNAVLFKKIFTPVSLEAYSGNDHGTMGGWAMTPQQVNFTRFPASGVLKNLYFAGHWTYPGIGVRNSAISGRNTAKLILGG